MAKIVGIDLGTTNSCVAVIEGGEPVVIANAEGARTTPSVVAFGKDGERMVGQVAKRQAITNPDKTVASIKRQMGTDYKVTIDDKKFTPQEISAMILQKLKADAEAVAAKLNGVSLKIAVKVSETGSIFGGVTNADIAAELAKLGIEIDRKIIVIKEAVKKLGEYSAVVRLHKEVQAEVAFEVVAE